MYRDREGGGTHVWKNTHIFFSFFFFYSLIVFIAKLNNTLTLIRIVAFCFVFWHSDIINIINYMRYWRGLSCFGDILFLLVKGDHQRVLFRLGIVSFSPRQGAHLDTYNSPGTVRRTPCWFGAKISPRWGWCSRRWPWGGRDRGRRPSLSGSSPRPRETLPGHRHLLCHLPVAPWPQWPPPWPSRPTRATWNGRSSFTLFLFPFLFSTPWCHAEGREFTFIMIPVIPLSLFISFSRLSTSFLPLHYVYTGWMARPCIASRE